MTSSSLTAVTINLMPVLEKLICDNHVMWKAQVLAVLHGTWLAEFLDGTNMASSAMLKIKSHKEPIEDAEGVPNPAYDLWRAQEQ
jgi:hypothetical protein